MKIVSSSRIRVKNEKKNNLFKKNDNIQIVVVVRASMNT